MAVPTRLEGLANLLAADPCGIVSLETRPLFPDLVALMHASARIVLPDGGRPVN